MKLELIINYVFFLVTIFLIYLSLRNLTQNPKRNEVILQFIDKHATKIVLFILLIFTLVKLYKIAELPHENMDEQFVMYQIKSFLRIGTDMYGAKFPVYSRAWGCGMSMGYIYLACLFCKFFGVSYFTVRLPMALVGTLSGWFIYLIGKNKSKLYGIMATIIYCFIPFNFLAQRWALDRTIFPLIFIIATYFAIEYFKKQKPWTLYVSFILYGLSLYGYANAYIIVPVFLLFCLFYGLKNKKICFKDAIGPSIILALLALPLILFVLKCVLGIIDIDKFLFFTIHDAVTERGSEFGLHFDQIPKMIKTLFGRVGDPGIPRNICELYYLFMCPFTALGIYSFVKKLSQKSLDIVDSVVLFLTSFLMLYGLLIFESNAGKLNVLMFVFPFLITEGVDFCFKKNSKYWLTFASFTVICFTLFAGRYFINDGYPKCWEKELHPIGIEKLINDIQYDETLADKNVYLICFLHHGSPTLLNSVDMTDEEMMNLEYIRYPYPGRGTSEAFTKVGRFELLKSKTKSPSLLAKIDGTDFEFDSNGVYIIPDYKNEYEYIKTISKDLEEKLLETIEYRYISEYENYKIYY